MRRIWLLIAVGAVSVIGLVVVGQTYWWNVQQDPTGIRTGERSGASQAGRVGSIAENRTPSGRYADITETHQPVQLGPEQLAKLREFVAGRSEIKVTDVDYSISIGAAVPRQAALFDLPAELSRAMNGYHGDKFVVVGDRMVIVDDLTRRIVAIIPHVG